MNLLKKIDLFVNDEISTGDVATNTAKGKIDVVGGKCPEGQKYCKVKKVCVPINNESARNPKPGDRFEYKGKKLTVTHVGSGLTNDTYIDVQFDKEKHKRSISMKNFFKGNDFKYINESSMKLTSKKTKAGRFLTNLWTLELPEPIPEFGNTKYSSGTKDQMKNLAKKYGRKYGWRLRESSVVGGSYIGGTTTNIIGSGQTRIWGVKRGDMLDLVRKEPVDTEMDDPTDTNILGRKGLKFDKKSGAYVPSLWGEDE